MRYNKDYESHSQGLIWKTFTRVWQGLSNAWQLVTTNRKLVTVAWKGWNALVSPLTNYMSRHRYDYSYDSDSYLKDNYDPIPVELTFNASTEVYDSTTGEPTGAYYVPPEYRNILILQDFINSPDVVLSKFDGDYTFVTGLPNKERGVIDLSDVDHPTKMWATAYKIKSLEDIYERFGVFVGYDKYQHEENETIRNIDKLFYTQQFGPSLRNLEVAICVVNDWPSTAVGGTVVSKTSTLLTIQTEEGLYNVSNDTGLPFRRRDENDAWIDISVGDTLDSYVPLTEAVIVEDLILNPDWNESFPVSDEEKYHTFLVKFNANITQNASGYLIDQSKSLQRILRDKKVFSKPYLAIVLEADCEFSNDSTSYDNILVLDLDSHSTQYDAMLMLNMDEYLSTYGDAPALLSGALITKYADIPLTLSFDSLYNHYVQFIGTLDNSILDSSYGTVSTLSIEDESSSYE